MAYTGSCLCGQARYSSKAEPMMQGHCYCIDCRKSSGTGHCTHVAVMDLEFVSEGPVAVYAHPADSGNLVYRAFCPTCGTHLYSTNEAMPGAVFMRASSLDDPGLAEPQMSVFAGRAPAWDRPDERLPAFDRMPPGAPGGEKLQA